MSIEEQYTLETDPVVAGLREKVQHVDIEVVLPIAIALAKYLEDQRFPLTDEIGERKGDMGYRIHDPIQESNKTEIFRKKALEAGVDPDFVLGILDAVMWIATSRQFKRLQERRGNQLSA